MNEMKAPMEKKPVSHGAAGSKPPAAITTFVQVNTDTFRDIVQRLTGPSSSSSSSNNNNNEKQQQVVVSSKRPTSKLHERRQYYSRPKLEIVKPPCNFHFQSIMDRRRQCCSPSSFLQSPSSRSPVGTPSTTFSKLSILEHEKNKDSQQNSTKEQEREEDEEEEKAIKERRFYLHPSPRSNTGFTEPELLTLFPLTSPRTSDQSPA